MKINDNYKGYVSWGVVERNYQYFYMYRVSLSKMNSLK